VLRRQIDGRFRREGALVDTLTGADEGKQDEPVHPAEILPGVASELLLEKVRVRVRLADEGGGAVNVEPAHPFAPLLERIRVVQLPPNPK
jgi:hypothetical protein